MRWGRGPPYFPSSFLPVGSKLAGDSRQRPGRLRAAGLSSAAVSAPPRMYLARHGQTAYNAEGRFQGQGAVPLDATGREQAAALAEQAVAYEFVALWCSP